MLFKYFVNSVLFYIPAPAPPFCMQCEVLALAFLLFTEYLFDTAIITCWRESMGNARRDHSFCNVMVIWIIMDSCGEACSYVYDQIKGCCCGKLLHDGSQGLQPAFGSFMVFMTYVAWRCARLGFNVWHVDNDRLCHARDITAATNKKINCWILNACFMYFWCTGLPCNQMQSKKITFAKRQWYFLNQKSKTEKLMRKMYDTFRRKNSHWIYYYTIFENWKGYSNTTSYDILSVLGSSVGRTPAGLTYVFAKGVSDQVRDPLTPRNSLQ